MVQTRILDVPLTLKEGRDCERCVGRLRDSLLEVNGVQSADVDLASSTLTLVYDPSLVALETVERRAEEIGAELGATIAHRIVPLAGMDCPDCAAKVEKAVLKLPGVLSAQVSFTASRMVVEYQADRVSLDQIVGRVRSLGYGAAERGEPEETPSVWQRHKLAISTGVSGLALTVGVAAQHLGAPQAAVDACYAAAMLAGAYYMARGAVASVMAAAFDTNFLMLLAAIGAVSIGQWAEGALVIFLFSLGSTLESYTTERTRSAIRRLMQLAPEKATLVANGVREDVPVREIAVGDVVLVRPGSRLPVDGVVVAGSSAVDESPITGESMPIEKGEGDEVYAGSINQTGALHVRATKAYEDTALARIVHLVEEAQALKAPSQRFTEQFGRIYTPTVIGVALVLGLVVPLVAGNFHAWFPRSLTLLVVACPCALVISTPVAIAAAIARAARMGVLIKGGAYLEQMGGLRVAAFDKTGTLTTGKPSVAEVVAFGESSAREVLRAAASVEALSEHPIAAAVVAASRERGLVLQEAKGFTAEPGRGAFAVVEGTPYWVGSVSSLAGSGVDLSPAKGIIEEWQRKGQTVVLVASGRWLIGALAVQDTVRPNAPRAIQQLRAVGIRRIVMLTGDEDATAASVAASLGLDEYRARLLPAEKVDAVNALQEQYGRVLMVGDGINDAPALAAATVGVAMGATGTGVALETADVALMSDDLTRLPAAIALSRQAMAIVRQNVAFACAVVLMLVLTTLTTGLRLSAGVLGHEGSALLVILNGMRLLSGRRVAAEASLAKPESTAHRPKCRGGTRLSHQPGRRGGRSTP
jgi:Cd2+/Zn2+-exporting ATPase